jgi:hypothetical protein
MFDSDKSPIRVFSASFGVTAADFSSPHEPEEGRPSIPRPYFRRCRKEPAKEVKRIQVYHHEKLSQALDRYGGVRRRRVQSVRHAVGRHQARELRYMNPFARGVWLHHLIEAAKFYDIRSRTHLSAITIISPDWDFDEKNWRLDLGQIKRNVRTLLRGYNYLLHIEFAYFRNYRVFDRDTGEIVGRLVSPHLQGLIWGPRPGWRGRKKGLRRGITGARPVVVIPVSEARGGLDGALTYMTKPPFHGYTRRGVSDRQFRSRPTDLTLRQHHFLLSHLFDLDWPTLAMSGGEGIGVLRMARACADRPFRPKKRRAPSTTSRKR